MLRSAVPPTFLFALLSLISGCAGTFEVVQEARTGGTVALHGSESGAREKAEAHMKARCPRGYEITEEGEAVVAGDREWRLTYACRGASGDRAQLAF